MPVIEAQCASILVSHDHRHINQKRIFAAERRWHKYASWRHYSGRPIWMDERWQATVTREGRRAVLQRPLNSGQLWDRGFDRRRCADAPILNQSQHPLLDSIPPLRDHVDTGDGVIRCVDEFELLDTNEIDTVTSAGQPTEREVSWAPNIGPAAHPEHQSLDIVAISWVADQVLNATTGQRSNLVLLASVV